MTREQALIVAKLAYADVMKVMKDWEDFDGQGKLIDFCWDECIRIEDNLFHGHELRD